MVIKYVSVCEYSAPINNKKLDYLQRMVCFGKHKDSTGFMFEPFLLGEKKVLHIEKLPYPMRTQMEVREWFKTEEAKHLFDIVQKIKPITKIIQNMENEIPIPKGT